MSIVIVDYGIGNVKSILNSFESQNEKVSLSRDKEKILNATGLILPGVGAFSHGMNNLKKYKLIPVIKDYVDSGKPLLGICLGMQLLLESSEEFGFSKGLGIIEGEVIKLPIKTSNEVKLPHISWNEINKKNISWNNTILDGIKPGSDMYFVHTYAAKPKNESEILSKTNYYDVEFCSSLKKKNIYGCQFHPEKSSTNGLSIIKNFINISKNNI